MSKSLAALLPIITWNVENVLNELDELAKEIFRQSGEDANWILLVSYSKMREERNKLKEVLLNREEQELDAFENF